MNNMIAHINENHYVKYIIIQVDPFESKIIAEKNFSIDEKYEIRKFKETFLYRDDYIIIKIEL